MIHPSTIPSQIAADLVALEAWIAEAPIQRLEKTLAHLDSALEYVGPDEPHRLLQTGRDLVALHLGKRREEPATQLDPNNLWLIRGKSCVHAAHHLWAYRRPACGNDPVQGAEPYYGSLDEVTCRGNGCRQVRGSAT